MESEKMQLLASGVYAIINRLNGNRYIGSTIRSFTVRWGTHRRLLQRRASRHLYLQNAWAKYGADAFVFEIVEVVADKSMTRDRETYWIQWHADQGHRLYNLCTTAVPFGGLADSPEYRSRLSAKRRIDWTNPTYRALKSQQSRIMWQSEAYRQQASKHLTRQWSDEKRRQNMSRWAKERWKDPKYRKRILQKLREHWESPQQRERVANWSNTLWSDPEHRTRVANKLAGTFSGFVAPDGTIHTPVVNLTAFCREHDLHTGAMSRVASGKTRQHKGWKRYEEPSP